MEQQFIALTGEIQRLEIRERTRLEDYNEVLKKLEELEDQMVELKKGTPERRKAFEEHERLYFIYRQKMDAVLITRNQLAEAREDLQALLREHKRKLMEGGSFIPSRGNTKLNKKIEGGRLRGMKFHSGFVNKVINPVADVVSAVGIPVAKTVASVVAPEVIPAITAFDVAKKGIEAVKK